MLQGFCAHAGTKEPAGACRAEKSTVCFSFTGVVCMQVQTKKKQTK